MQYDLEIVIPVFHEEGNILKTLNNILEKVKLNYRIIVVYDYTEDPTLKVIKDNFQTEKIFLLKNKYKGFNGAIKSAFEIVNSKATILYFLLDISTNHTEERQYTDTKPEISSKGKETSSVKRHGNRRNGWHGCT